MGFLQRIKAGLHQGMKVRTAAVAPNDTEQASRWIEDGNLLEDAGSFSEALRLYESAIAIAPQYARAYINKGIALHAMGRLDQAISCYSHALTLEPDNAKTHFNIGNAWQANRQYELALGAYERALALDPKFVDAWLAHGNNLGDMGQPRLAIESYLHASRLNPNYFQVHQNLGLIYCVIGEFRSARKHIETAIEIQPQAIENYIELSNIYRALGDIGNAITAARMACNISPGSAPARSLLLFCLMHSPDISRIELFRAHLEFGGQFDRAPARQQPSIIRDKNPQRTLQVGIVSPDLYAHSVASFFTPVFEILSKTPGLVFFIYYTGELQDSVTQHLKEKTAHWIDAASMTDDALEQRIRADEIDILIDLSGHTNGHRLTVFGKKPAPLQMSWIGYPGTTGMTTMDYYIGDRHFLPPGEFEELFSEKIIRLPATAPFKLAEDLPEVNELPALANGHLTFGSFNRMDKINRDVVALWSKLLHAVPDAKLLMGGLPAESELAELLGWFSSCGIDSSRLILHTRSDMNRYLRLHHAVDVCLDTFPYGGSTTSCHALTMGVPTLTLAGATPIANAGRSILSQVSIEHLFAAVTKDDFVSKGVWCAHNMSELSELRANLRQRALASNLMHPAAIANAFVIAARHAWQRSCAGLLPEAFEVVERDGQFEILPG